LFGQRNRLAELAQLSAWLAESTGCGDFGGGTGFALGNRVIVGFEFRHGIQPVAELAATGIEIAPLGVARPRVGGDLLVVKFFFKGGQLRARAVELPFQIVSFHSHVDFVCLKLSGGFAIQPKNEAGLWQAIRFQSTAVTAQCT
jgi:hypothetical protein